MGECMVLGQNLKRIWEIFFCFCIAKIDQEMAFSNDFDWVQGQQGHLCAFLFFQFFQRGKPMEFLYG